MGRHFSQSLVCMTLTNFQCTLCIYNAERHRTVYHTTALQQPLPLIQCKDSVLISLFGSVLASVDGLCPVHVCHLLCRGCLLWVFVISNADLHQCRFDQPDMYRYIASVLLRLIKLHRSMCEKALRFKITSPLFLKNLGA
jgi:hypothetical protein